MYYLTIIFPIHKEKPNAIKKDDLLERPSLDILLAFSNKEDHVKAKMNKNFNLNIITQYRKELTNLLDIMAYFPQTTPTKR